MTKQRLITTFSAAAVVLLALAGCSSASPESTGAAADGSTAAAGEIDFFTVSGQIPLINTLADQVTSYLEGRGYTVVVKDAQFDPAKQAQQIEQAVSTGSIVGAWIFPVAPEALTQSVQLLQSKQVPVVLEAQPSDFGFDGAQPGVVFDASDYVQYATTIATDAADCATSNGGTEALFLSAPGSSGGSTVIPDTVQKVYGEAAPSAPIVDTAQAGDPASAQSAVTQLLIAHPDADVVIAATDETAVGAVGAFKAAGRTPACVVVGGGGQDVLAAQKAGDITEVVAWDYAASAKASGDSLITLIGDPTAEGTINPTAISVIK
ncbi:substrate-binding domain-containing protein [Herbiconiux sp.]|uniref:substrate-binding domain-containing protein n=1 Tax=Herbiconiux sp. TaxID=1871186 RepID=UPI0025B9D44F|nr:substrate-binding domain-containing protein [Herbiconiux sp.]